MLDDALTARLHKILCPRKEEHEPRFCSVLNPVVPMNAATEALAFFREQVAGPLAIVCQRHGCMWEAHEHCEDALADRDARLARLVEALRQIQRDVVSDPGNRWCRNALIVADAALADAGARKEQNDE